MEDPQGIDWILECGDVTEDVLVSCGASHVSRAGGTIPAGGLDLFRPVVNKMTTVWSAWVSESRLHESKVTFLWNSFKDSCFLLMQEEVFRYPQQPNLDMLDAQELKMARDALLQITFELRFQHPEETESYTYVEFGYIPFQSSCWLGSKVTISVSRKCDTETQAIVADRVCADFSNLSECLNKEGSLWKEFCGSYGGLNKVGRCKTFIQKSPLSPQSAVVFEDAMQKMLKSCHMDLSFRVALSCFDNYSSHRLCPLWLLERIMQPFNQSDVMYDFVLSDASSVGLEYAVLMTQSLPHFQVFLPTNPVVPRCSWQALDRHKKQLEQCRMQLRKGTMQDRRFETQVEEQRSRESFFELLLCLKCLSIRLPLELRKIIWCLAVGSQDPVWRLHGHLVLSSSSTSSSRPVVTFRCLACIQLCDLRYDMDILNEMHPVARLCPVHRALVFHHHYNNIKEPSAKVALLHSTKAPDWHYSERFPESLPKTLLPHSLMVTPQSAVSLFPYPCTRASPSNQIWIFSGQDVNEFWFGDKSGVMWESQNKNLCK